MNMTKRDVLNLVEQILLAPEKAEERTQPNPSDGSLMTCTVYDILCQEVPQLGIEKWEVKNSIPKGI